MVEPHPRFDVSRIADHPDKQLLGQVYAYWNTFVQPDPDAMRSFQADGYTMTDIPLCVVNVDRDTWYQANKAFVSMAADTTVTAISLAGNSRFSVLENLVQWNMAMDPPEGPARNLPPGVKKGDPVAMIMCSTVWWTEDGKVSRELEYGRLVWETFDLAPFERPPGQGTSAVYKNGMFTIKAKL